MLKSTSSLKERLQNWSDWDGVCYEVGVCLGFWPDFGAPDPHDPWHGVKGIIWSSHPLGEAIGQFVIALTAAGMLEENPEVQLSYRWNKDYKELDNE